MTVYGTLMNFKGEHAALGAAMDEPPYKAPPKAPVLYVKPANTWTPDGGDVPVPARVAEVEIGATIAMVMNGPNELAGFRLMNDLSIPHASFFRPPVKFRCLDGFLGMGSTLLPAAAAPDPATFVLQVSVNDAPVQAVRFADLVRPAGRLLADVAEFMTLQDGDALMLGCDTGRPRARIGDRITISCEGLGTLTNTLVAEDAARWEPHPASGSRPRTILALGLNYADHAKELAFKAPEEPLAFLKGDNALGGHEGFTKRPPGVEFMHYECELAVVIGRRARNVKRADAYDYIGGYTVANDYAVRDYLENWYRPNLRVKNRDGATPLGPRVVPRAAIPDPMALALRTTVNGKLTQSGNTKDMIFDVPYLIEYFTSFMTLMPGDLILTGTPDGVVDCRPGDVVVTGIEGIGALVNTIS